MIGLLSFVRCVLVSPHLSSGILGKDDAMENDNCMTVSDCPCRPFIDGWYALKSRIAIKVGYRRAEKRS